MIRANKEHRVLAVKDFEDQDIDDVSKRPAFCQQKHHEKEELKLFCKVCEVAICNSCVATIHYGHAKILLEEAAKERKLQVKSVIESQKETAQQKRNKIDKLDQNCVQIQAQAPAVKRDVDKVAESMMTVTEAKKRKTICKSESKARESVERLQAEQCREKDKVKLIETAIEKTEAHLERSRSAEDVQLDKSLNTISQGEENDEEDKEEQVDCDIEGLRRFMFVEKETLMDNVDTEGIGSFKTFLSKTEPSQSSAEGKGICQAIVGLEAQCVLTTRNAEREQCYEEGDYVTVEIKNRQGHDCATKALVQDNKDGSYKISYFAKETGNCEASVKLNGEHVRGSPFAVQVKTREFRPVLSFGQQGSSVGMLSYPWGVAVNERDEIAVTGYCNHRVQVFSCVGTYLRSFGRQGDKQGEFQRPAGIAFDKNGNIIVVDSSNHRVQLFSEQGEYLSQFGGKGSLDHQLNIPHGLSVDSDGNTIIADTYNKLIKIFSPSGQCLRKIGREGSFTCPFHCVHYEKNFIVSDSVEHCIKVFDEEGNFLYRFGKKGDGDGEFNTPRCLSVNKAGHLMVCDDVNHRVQVFELSGKFIIKLITKFGTKGRGKGKLNMPMSTAVLSDGRIVVSDFNNHRIQIFE